jgi:hypothetical protein
MLCETWVLQPRMASAGGHVSPHTASVHNRESLLPVDNLCPSHKLLIITIMVGKVRRAPLLNLEVVKRKSSDTDKRGIKRQAASRWSR